jgi:hypothetical protein
MVNPVPVRTAVLMVTAWVPVEVSVRACVPSEFSDTLPKATVVELALSKALPALSCNAKDWEDPSAAAVSVAVCAVVTAAAVAVNPALTAPSGTVILPGTVTAGLLLARATARPPAGAAELRLTAQLSVPEPVMDELPQESPLTLGVDDPPEPLLPPDPPPPPEPPPPDPPPEPELTAPVPLRPITMALPEEPLVVMVSCPVIIPALAGSNCTFMTMTWPGPKMTGSANPEILKPAPVSAAESIVTGSVPEEVRTTDCVAVVFVAT